MAYEWNDKSEAEVIEGRCSVCAQRKMLELNSNGDWVVVQHNFRKSECSGSGQVPR